MTRPLRVLFLCTGNSARSQMAEAILNRQGGERFRAESAGSNPAPRVNPHAIETLAEWRVPWTGHPPRGVADLKNDEWDIVITLCDHARESCPIFPGHPAMAHWGMPDPALATGTAAEIHAAFRAAFVLLSRRIELLLALPIEKLERMVLETRLRAIGGVQADAVASSPGIHSTVTGARRRDS